MDKEEYRFKAVLDRVSNTGAVWLGLTLGCAHCHDHPYDAVTQREFYELAAIFNNADETEIELPGGTSRRAQARKFSVLSRARDAAQLRGCSSAATSSIRARRSRRECWQALHPLSAAPSQAPREQPINRLDLAPWLVDSSNPLTPRVLSNQIWLHLFGQGLVRTPEDFGARGEPPTHPELLDWLARELLTRGWSRKAMIRQSRRFRDVSAVVASSVRIGRCGSRRTGCWRGRIDCASRPRWCATCTWPRADC